MGLFISLRRGINVTLISLFFLVSWGYGADFMILPVRIYIEKGKNTTVFEIRNLSDEEISIETTAKKWTIGENGKYILEDTEDIIVIPPIINLKKKQKQLIKIAYLGDPPEKTQKAYRLILRQIPKEIEKKEGKDIRSVIQIVYNISVPIFVNPLTEEPKYKIEIKPLKITKKEIQFEVKNIGNGFARFLGFTLYKNDEPIFSKRFPKYILPETDVVFTIKLKNDQEITENPDKIKFVLEDENEIIIDL